MFGGEVTGWALDGGRAARSPSAVALVFVAAAFMVGGCLDAGGPPSGQRWISGRTQAFRQFVAAGAGAAPTSLLVSDARDQRRLHAVSGQRPRAGVVVERATAAAGA